MSHSTVAARLDNISEALGLTLDDLQRGRLLAYLQLLQKWNGTYNLTAIRDPDAMLTQHLADCLAVVRPLTRQLPPAAARLLDVGSGGGLPGVVWAVMLPQVAVTCIDAVGKKAAFVRQVSAELRLTNLSATHGRVEALQAPPFDVVASRAFASLSDFIRLTPGLVAPTGCWLAMKGKAPVDEVLALREGVTVFHVEHLVVPGMDAERCLVWMRPSIDVVLSKL